MSSRETNQPKDELAEDLLQILKDSAETVFRTMLGSTGTLSQEWKPEDGSDRESVQADLSPVEHRAVVTFSGPRNGAIILRAGAKGALDIATGLLMPEEGEELGAEDLADAFGECANMLCGTLKSNALDPRGSFKLGIPMIGTGPLEETARPLGVLVYHLFEGTTAVEVWLDDPPEEDAAQRA